MCDSLILHPHHPATRTVILRLALVCAVLLCTPAWVVYKALWLYVGAEVFVLWHMRELYPEYRRATLPYWCAAVPLSVGSPVSLEAHSFTWTAPRRWLMVGAPTDVDYALFVLRQRNLEQRPLRGRQTLRRTARAQEGDRGSRSAKAKEAVRRGGRAVLRGDKEVLLADGGVEKVQGGAPCFPLISLVPCLPALGLTRCDLRLHSLLRPACLDARHASSLSLRHTLHALSPPAASRPAHLAPHALDVEQQRHRRRGRRRRVFLTLC